LSLARAERARSVGAWAPPRLRPVLYLVGGVLVALGLLMLLPALVDLASGHPDWRVFAQSSAITVGVGLVLALLTRTRLDQGLSLRQALIVTPMSWTVVATFGALPMWLSGYGTLAGSFTNAFFESMSGLTTTGSTVIVGLDAAPPGLLLWRALLQWLGGIGIIAAAIAILPALGIGGMQLFRTESSDRSEKVVPRARQFAVAIAGTYAGLTLLCAVLYWLGGMTVFEAVAHALTTLSTGGYSTSDQSLGRWDSPAIHWTATLFMIAAALPFVLYVRFLRRERDVLRDRQVRSFLVFLAVVVAAMTLGLAASETYGPLDALRHAAFNVVSVVTTTGFATTDYLLWGNAAIGVFFGLTFIGGCTGSTSGGIKIFRFEVMAALLRAHLYHLLHPKGVFPRVYAGRVLPDEVIGSVVVFFSLYFICYSVLTVALMALDLDFVTSISSAVTALSNVGPGLGPIVGPAGNFATLPDLAKWLLAFGMLMGRLELFVVLVLFMPRFWRG
jgi:trk system potassium uptake protein TrkH